MSASNRPSPSGSGPTHGVLRRCARPSLLFFLILLGAALFVGIYRPPTWSVQKISLDVAPDEISRDDRGEPSYISTTPAIDQETDGKRGPKHLLLLEDEAGKLYYLFEGKPLYLEAGTPQDWEHPEFPTDALVKIPEGTPNGPRTLRLTFGAVQFKERGDPSYQYKGKAATPKDVLLLKDDRGHPFFVSRGMPAFLLRGEPSYFTPDGPGEFKKLVLLEKAQLGEEAVALVNAKGSSPLVEEEYAFEGPTAEEPVTQYFQLAPKRHWGFWSLLPALAAVGLCWLTREPLPSLFGGIVVGAFLLGSYDITGAVLVPSLATVDAARVLLLYLWLLGGLLGVWSRTGAAQAFADLMTRKFVRGPRSAKLVAWCLGVLFFQGGTVSTVLVGTTVKPLADQQRISHEELSYIVDSTASPIASQLAFNAWPTYVQSFIFVAGVPWLATEVDRIAFFFRSVPFCFYAIFAVSFTFLLSIEWSPFLGGRMRRAIRRARETGELDAPDAEPLSAKELQASCIPEGYRPSVFDFFLPLFLLIGTAIGTFIALGSPKVLWAFGLALGLAIVMALVRGMKLRDVVEGFGEGLKGVVLGSVILLLAVTIGSISKNAGGGLYLVELLGSNVPFWLLPVLLQVLTIIIAFSTGTSWGTYAVAFPLAMPLAWEVAQVNELAHPMFFMTLCFAAVMDGSVSGDQCSPISDTTVLSSMCTGCDLMDHVRTQLPQASVAALMAGICWTAVAAIFC